MAWGQAVGACRSVIVYNLRCKNGHEFEGWFRDSAAYDLQSEDGKLSCPDLQFAQGGKSHHGAGAGGRARCRQSGATRRASSASS